MKHVARLPASLSGLSRPPRLFGDSKTHTYSDLCAAENNSAHLCARTPGNCRHWAIGRVLAASGKHTGNYKKKGKTVRASTLTRGIGLLSVTVAWAQSLGPVAAFALTHGGEHDERHSIAHHGGVRLPVVVDLQPHWSRPRISHDPRFRTCRLRVLLQGRRTAARMELGCLLRLHQAMLDCHVGADGRALHHRRSRGALHDRRASERRRADGHPARRDRRAFVRAPHLLRLRVSKATPRREPARPNHWLGPRDTRAGNVQCCPTGRR